MSPQQLLPNLNTSHLVKVTGKARGGLGLVARLVNTRPGLLLTSLARGLVHIVVDVLIWIELQSSVLEMNKKSYYSLSIFSFPAPTLPLLSPDHQCLVCFSPVEVDPVLVPLKLVVLHGLEDTGGLDGDIWVEHKSVI